MIRSTKTSLKFTNIGKLDSLNELIHEYSRVVRYFVDILWEVEKIPAFLPKEITNKVDTWLSARMKQSAGKQASGIVRGVTKKQKSRKWQIGQFYKNGHNKKARKLQKIYDLAKITKPNINIVNLQLDSRFIKIDLDNNTIFDGWLTISSIGDKTKIKIPFKKTKHFNKLTQNGKMRTSARLSKENIEFAFDIKETPKKSINQEVIGIDIGQNVAVSCSNGFQSKQCKHGHTLSTISDKLSQKCKGSKGFKRTQSHRTNYTNWSIKQLNLDGISTVKIENIKNLRRCKRSNRRLSHWNYRAIFDKLESYCQEQGVLVEAVNPAYTSQRCSSCGWTRKKNRSGKQFKCTSCGHTADADLNAARNISCDLSDLSDKSRIEIDNRTGFYYNVQ